MPLPVLPTHDLAERVAEATAGIQARTPLCPEVAITLGSGLGALADLPREAVAIPTAEIPHWPRSTVPGHAGRLVVGLWEGVPVALLAGRSHRYEGYALDQVTFGVRVMRGLGAERMIFTNAVGAVNPDFVPGDVMLATDHVNAIGKRGLFTPAELAERHAGRRVAALYDPGLGRALEEAARASGIGLRRGVLLGGLGPAYETAAEIRFARRIGVDAVCMSTVPEVTVAAHLGARAASLSCITNPATGLASAPLSHREVVENADRMAGKLRRILEAFLRARVQA